ncbi:LysE family translocator [Sedimentitalea sp. JM2-8]|uniref:LysE family translocator n=1 Tax=Sedimentitalea xiamensis TaxID=3050037 RepID=A0ABT7FBR5_9RHOB|nr:LysE family translocator [Sedimentitalea xiamensis]MDK3072284.1 LysE family translocator [Sedimentitalea xiamensis]
MLTFAAAVFFLLITPGPGVLSTAGVGSGFGAAAGIRYVGGLFLGTNLVALAVVSGLAAVLLADPRLRMALFVLSAAYLLYLAVRIAFAGSRLAFIRRRRPPGVYGGIALQVINPKAYAVNTTLFTGFSFLPGSLAAETLLKFLIINVIWVPIHFLWLWAGIKLGELDLPRRTHVAINAAMAVSMLLVVGLAVLAQFHV